MRSLRGVIPSHLRQRTDTLAVLDHLLAECLPADCLAHCRVAGIQDDTLVLIADSPAWRSRIHFSASRIIDHFNRLDKLTLSRLRVRVGRPEPPMRRSRGRPPGGEPPPATARALAELADEVDDPDLGASLRRLASRGTSGDRSSDG